VTQPLVVTLGVDDAAQGGWDRLRRRWFPAERLVVDAHLTLFHALPGERLAAVSCDLEEVTGEMVPFLLAVTEVRSLGRGVALRVRSEELDQLHAVLSDRWRPWLTPQDARRLDAHVTIQNKVSPEEARTTLAEVRRAFVPGEATATGLALWRYIGGPWEPLGTYRFRSAPSPNRQG
jgi:2'-5' RNA ligase